MRTRQKPEPVESETSTTKHATPITPSNYSPEGSKKGPGGAAQTFRWRFIQRPDDPPLVTRPAPPPAAARLPPGRFIFCPVPPPFEVLMNIMKKMESFRRRRQTAAYRVTKVSGCAVEMRNSIKQKKIRMCMHHQKPVMREPRLLFAH